MPDLLLCSRSPRRARLLEAAGIPFRFGPVPDVDETPPAGLAPSAVARALAERKARAVIGGAGDALVLCADTVVALSDGTVLAKPADEADAARMLGRLSGRTHEVSTGVAVAWGARLESGVRVARVRFRRLEAAEIAAYVRTGEPLDKAGAYAIQGGARDFVETLDGPLDTVVGLPVALVVELIGRVRAAGLGSEAADGR